VPPSPAPPIAATGEPLPSGESNDDQRIAAVLGGATESFEGLVVKYSPRLFATARRYARRENDVEDIVQEVWTKAFQKLATFRRDAPFEHWLMRLAIRTCYDFLRQHRRNRETAFSELSDPEENWLDQFSADPDSGREDTAAARQLVERILNQLSPSARLIITLLEIEDRPVKEIAQLTGWSITLVKVRAFRARAEMKRCLQRITQNMYL